MRKNICFFILLNFLFHFAIAQNGAKQPQAADFILTDTQGHTYHLYDELNTGKTVVLDFFSVSCGSCATSVSVLDQIWQQNSGIANGLWVWGIEVYQATAAQIDTFSVENGGTYPCFTADENDSIFQQYEIQYTPRFYVVCPDKRRIPSLLGDIQMNIDQCRLSSDALVFQNKSEAIIFISDKENLYFTLTDNQAGIFEIVDMYGRVVKQFPCSSTNNTISISKSALSYGIYLYRFAGKSYTKTTGKFIIM